MELAKGGKVAVVPTIGIPRADRYQEIDVVIRKIAPDAKFRANLTMWDSTSRGHGMIHVFLSASVPLPNRDPEFLDTADVVAIREAVKALVGEVIPKGILVFGGHPAITPLLSLLLRGLGPEARRRIILYQSARFSDQFAPENDEFLDYRVIPAVGRSKARSIAAT